MKISNTDKKRYYKYAAIVLSIVFLISAGLFFLNLWERGLGDKSSFKPEGEYLKYEGKEYRLKKNVETFLVLGLDKFDDAPLTDSYNNNRQADFLMLFVLDNDAKTCSAIHINRDTMANVNVLGVAGNRVDTVTKQIALAHTYGNGKEVSCRNTLDAVSDLLLGMKIDHYISVTMDAVPVYNDLLGGIEVEILDDFTGIDAELVKGSRVTLAGEQALTYVRTRYGLEDSTNSTRMNRQRQYLAALRTKSFEKFKDNDEFLIETTVKMSEYIVSDRSVNQLQELLRKITEYEFIETADIKGESKVGERFAEFYPDRKSIEEVVIKQFYTEKD